MPNIATLFKSEVARLTRKELKLQLEPLRKQLASQRKTIATLRADISKLQKEVASKDRKAVAVERADDAPATRVRFSASGLKKLRSRLGLSRELFGVLLGASAQSIYLWETDQNRPRTESVSKIAIVRGMTKRQVDELLAQHGPAAKKAERQTSRKIAKKAAPAAKQPTKKAAVGGVKQAARKVTAAKRETKKVAETGAPRAGKASRQKVIKKAEQQSGPAHTTASRRSAI